MKLKKIFNVVYRLISAIAVACLIQKYFETTGYDKAINFIVICVPLITLCLGIMVIQEEQQLRNHEEIKGQIMELKKIIEVIKQTKETEE